MGTVISELAGKITPHLFLHEGYRKAKWLDILFLKKKTTTYLTDPKMLFVLLLETSLTLPTKGWFHLHPSDPAVSSNSLFGTCSVQPRTDCSASCLMHRERAWLTWAVWVMLRPSLKTWGTMCIAPVCRHFWSAQVLGCSVATVVTQKLWCRQASYGLAWELHLFN